MMKNSITTRVSLSNKVISSPLRSSASLLFGALLTLVVFALLVNLGFWQLGRGEEKQKIENDLKAREQLPPIPLVELSQINHLSVSENVVGIKISASLTTTSLPLIYLDNQTFEGKAGYLVYQALNHANSDTLLLVELGFVPTGNNREILPEVSKQLPTGVQRGRLYHRSLNPLSSDLMLETLDTVHSKIRIQNLNFDQLSQSLEQFFYPFALQPFRPEPPTLAAKATELQPQSGDHFTVGSLPQPWKPLPMSSSKHFGYAFQWFVMAGVWLLLMLTLLFKTNRVLKTDRQLKTRKRQKRSTL